jgi:hypothetical protein
MMTDEEIWTAICEIVAKYAGVSLEQVRAILAAAGFDVRNPVGMCDAIDTVLKRLGLWAKLAQHHREVIPTIRKCGKCERCGARRMVTGGEPLVHDSCVDPEPYLCDQCFERAFAEDRERMLSNHIDWIEAGFRKAAEEAARRKKIN